MRSSAASPHRSSSLPAAAPLAPCAPPAGPCCGPPGTRTRRYPPACLPPRGPACSICRAKSSQHRLVLARELHLHFFKHLRIARPGTPHVLLVGLQDQPDLFIDAVFQL